jgi:hypothetical protein
MLCATALAPNLPVEAQSCMTESLLYTYDDEPAAKPHRPRHKSVKKATSKVAKIVTATTNSTGSQNTTEAASQGDGTQTAAAPAVHIAENSLTTMRNHP